MRKLLVTGVMSTIVLIGAGAPADAAPQQRAPEKWVCDGADTLIVTAGRNGWIDDTKYHAVSFTIEGSFTPTGGAPEPFSESKTWAGGRDASSADLITCTADVSETDETGTFEAHFEVTAVPVG